MVQSEIELLMTFIQAQAAVRMGSVVFEWFDVHGGVRQADVSLLPAVCNLHKSCGLKGNDSGARNV